MLFDISAGSWDAELLRAVRGARARAPGGRPEQRPDRVDAGGRAARPRGAGGRAWRATSRRRCSARRASTRGSGKNTYGTGSFVLLNAGTPRPSPAEGLLTTVAWRIGDGRLTYALEAAIFVTGAAVQWLRDGLGIIAAAAETEALARSLRGQRRRLLRAGADRARLAALGPVRARHDRRADPRHGRRASGARGARVDRVPDASTRCGRSRRTCGVAAGGAARRRRREPPTTG